MVNNLKLFLKKRFNRFKGRILHAYDTKDKNFKEIFKEESNRLMNEIYDFLDSLGFEETFNVGAEEFLKEVEKKVYGETS